MSIAPDHRQEEAQTALAERSRDDAQEDPAHEASATSVQRDIGHPHRTDAVVASVFPAQAFGPKSERLSYIRQHSPRENLVLPLFPIAALEFQPASADDAFDLQLPRYRAALAERHPNLRSEVETVCGPAPWIVRSSGFEDQDNHVNAGGYDSLVCTTADELTECVARVALSGMHEHAQRQQALTAPKATALAISCFVQPLLDVAVSTDVEPDQIPIFDDALLCELESIAGRLMEAFGFEAIDCEWGLQTGSGFVSATTIMPRDAAMMNCAHTFGFGFAAAQNADGTATSTVLRPAGTDLRLWRGRSLRRVTSRRLHLLQARPAQVDPAHRETETPTDASFSELLGKYDAIQANLLIPGLRQRGSYMIAPTLASAWRNYLAMREPERATIAVVLVDEGSGEEHAGIMFRQQQIECLIIDTRCVPPGTSKLVFARGLCFFGDETMLGDVRTETRRLLSLPADCFLVFDALGADDENRRLPKPTEAHPALEALKALPLADDVLSGILLRSEWPTPECWIETDGQGVESPSRFARSLSLETKPGGGAGRANTYVASYEGAYLLSGVVANPDAALTRLSALVADIVPLARQKDLRIPQALLACESGAIWVRDEAMARILETASAYLCAGDRRSARLVLESVVRLAHDTGLLPVYLDEERADYADALADAYAKGLSPERVAALHPLGLPPTAFAILVRAIAADTGLIEVLSELQQAEARFRGAAFSPEAEQSAYRLNAAYFAFNVACTQDKRALPGIPALVRGTMIELYDATLKAMLTVLVSDPERRIYDRYLDVMRAWLAFARTMASTPRESTALDSFDAWLQAWRSSPLPADFTIEDRNWQIEFDVIATLDGTEARYDNAHAVHNLIHQWQLAGNAIDASLLPSRLHRLQMFCSTFSSRATKVLRFGRDLFEIEIPMGTHKASFVFTPQAIAVEWNEPPDCPDEEIARLLAFEIALDRYRAWMYDSLRVRREKVIGTWTLFARINAPEGGEWRWEEFGKVVAAVRFLFDSAYDFSYVDNDVVEGFAESLLDPVWKSIFEVFIGYRTVLDDVMQYVPLHTHPMSSALSSLAQMPLVRGLYRRCHRIGFEACMTLVDRYAQWVDRADDTGRWGRRYEMLRQVCFYTAAAWPRETVDALVATQTYHIGHDLLGACLFRRSDIRESVEGILSTTAPSLQGIYGLIARHAPEYVVTAHPDDRFLSSLIDADAAFRRAKQFALARATGQLDLSALKRLVADMDTVPFAHDPIQEARIANVIREIGPRYRFLLERGVDWATIDTWQLRHGQEETETGCAGSQHHLA